MSSPAEDAPRDAAVSALAPLAAAPDAALATPEAVAEFDEQFMRLLERRTAIYTQGDSSSVPTHVAADLLRSICFVLGIDPERREIPQELLGVNLEDAFRSHLKEIEREVELAGELWREVASAMPAIPSIALHDTVAEIGNFPRVYDFRSMAHEIPVSFDYQLCHPVDEDLQGVAYINEYLRRLLIESDFLARFEPAACIRVLGRTAPSFAETIINLYEPVATNAIGRALLGKNPRPLRLAEEDRAQIARLLTPLTHAARAKALRDAAAAACDALGVDDAAARDYLRELAADLLPRVEVALQRDTLRGVFV